MSGSIYIVVCADKPFSTDSNFEIFCFSEDGFQEISVTSFYEELSSNDVVFFDFSFTDLFFLSNNSYFLRLLKVLLIALGANGFLHNVYLEGEIDCLDMDGINLISFSEALEHVLDSSDDFLDEVFFPSVGLIQLLRLKNTSNNENYLKADFSGFTDSDILTFYKNIVISLVDEKISKDKIVGFGLSQALIVSRLNGLLDKYYKESDLNGISIINALAEKLDIKDIIKKSQAVFIFMLKSKFPGAAFDDEIDAGSVHQLLSNDYILDAQKELRTLFVMSSFSFFDPEEVGSSFGLKYKKAHMVDVCFSFLDEHHELLGHEDIIANFFYNALSYLNLGKKLKIIQVGAFDGIHGDFIHEFLMAEECNALLIEPQVDAFEKLRENCLKSKSNIQFLNKAIGPQSGFVKMFRVKSEFLNYYKRDDKTYLGRIASFDRAYVVDNIASKILKWGDGRIAETDASDFVETIDVEVVSFESIIDFKLLADDELVLQIDCEGFDFEIIKCFPIGVKRPALIHFESDKLGCSKSECFRYLINQGYLIIEHGPKVASDTLALDIKNKALLRSFRLDGISFQD